MKSLGWIVLGLAVLTLAGYVVYSIGFNDLEWRLRTDVLQQSPAVVVLEADPSVVERQRLEEAADAMAMALSQAQPRISYTGRGVVDGGARLRVVDPGDLPRARDVIAAALIQGFAYSENSASGVITLRPNAPPSAATPEALEHTAAILRSRLSGSGIMSRVTLENDRITVRALDVSNAEELAPVLVSSGRLTFNLVSDTSGSEIPAGYRVAPAHPLAPAAAPEVVRRRASISGHIVSASQTIANSGDTVVSFRFDEQGARIFCRITRENTGKRFAILLDDQVITAPIINEPICGGFGQLSGNFTQQSARGLAVVLAGGELPVALRVVETRTRAL